MRQQLVIWSLAALVFFGALVATVMRIASGNGTTTASAAGTASLLSGAMAALAEDPSAAHARTQDAIRAAAVRVLGNGGVSAEGAYLVALQYQREQNLRGAETYFKRAMALRPAWSAPYSGLGWLLGVHSMGRRAEAMEHVREAVALDPEDGRAYIALAVLLRFEGRLDEAQEAALAALRLEPDSVRAHNNYANLLIRREEYDKAEEHYLRAIAIDPDSTKPYYNLACLYALTGRHDQALAYLAKAVDLDPIYRGQATRDPDLDAVRALPGFARIVHQQEQEVE